MKKFNFFKSTQYYFILALLIISLFAFLFYYFNRKNIESMENTELSSIPSTCYCPEGCKPPTETSGNCEIDSQSKYLICPWSCPNPHLGPGCKYDIDCQGCRYKRTFDTSQVIPSDSYTNIDAIEDSD